MSISESGSGAEIRAAIMGDDWVTAAVSGGDDAMAQLSRISIENVWQTYWARGGLELRLRSTVTIAVLVALEAQGELVAHVKGALRNGLLTPAEIREIVLHTTPYLGFPRTRHAIEAINEIVGE